jgi:hypothetical protein
MASHIFDERSVPIALRGTADSQLADDLHDAGKEGQDHLREYRRFPRGLLGAAGPEFQKALDVFPSERRGGQQFFLLPFSQVVPQTLQIQISLIRELGIEAGLVYARRLFQFLKAGIGETVFSEDWQWLLEHALPAEVLGTSHRDTIAYRTAGFNFFLRRHRSLCNGLIGAY